MVVAFFMQPPFRVVMVFSIIYVEKAFMPSASEWINPFPTAKLNGSLSIVVV